MLRWGTLLVGLLATTGCELIGNIDKRTLAANGSDGGGIVTPVTDAGPPQTDLTHCVIAGSGTGMVRLGNLVPTTQRVDVCLRPSSVASFASVQPLFASAGPSCSAGMAYKDVTVSIPFPPDTYEAHVIPAGKSCSATPLATLSNVLVADQPTALHLLGNGTQAPTLRRYVESRPTSSSSSVMRLHHAAPSLAELDFGISSGSTLPASLADLRIAKLAFGQVTPNDPSQTAIDANGYVSQQVGSTRFGYVVAPTGTTAAELISVRTVSSGTAFSFFVVGRTDTPDFPLQMFGCDEIKQTGTVLANCSEAPPVTFTADAVNVQLSGPFSGAEDARRPAAFAAIAALTSDYVCVTEMYQQADKDALIKAAMNQFPYSYSPALTEQTPATDARNLAGVAVADPTTAACAQSVGKMNNMVDCMRDNCSTNVSDETAIAQQNPSNCLSQNCAGQAITLVNGNTNDATCWGCVFTSYNSYETMGNIRTDCTTDPTATKGFKGQSGATILSKRPLTNTDYFLMPSLGVWQTSVARATVVLDNGASVDLYCGAGSGVSSDCTLAPADSLSPVGTNADGTPPTDCIQASTNEQLLFNTRMRDWVASKSGPSHASTIFSGDLYCGPAYQSVVQADQPDNFAVLSAALSLGTAASYIPSCTDCADNPMRTPPGGTPSGDNTWTRFNLLQNIPVTAVQSNEVFLKTANVAGDPGNGATMVPISTYYAFRSVITITP